MRLIELHKEVVQTRLMSEQGKLWEERMNGPSVFWWGRGGNPNGEGGVAFYGASISCLGIMGCARQEMSPLFSVRPPFV